MFNIGNILKRAWQILWSYKLLWVFALLLAISGAAGTGGGGGGGGSSSYSTALRNEDKIQQSIHNPQWVQELEDWADLNITPLFATEELAIKTIIWFVVIIVVLSLLFSLVMALIRYPSETAVMRMVDTHEQSGLKYRFKEAWKLGWNRRAWRMFLVDLLIGTPAFTFVILLLAALAWIVFSSVNELTALLNPALIIGIIVFFILMMGFSLFMWMVSLLRQYVVRFSALENYGVWESFRRGWEMFKANFKNTFLMGLVLFGVGMIFGMALIFGFFLLIPAYAILTIPGAIIAAIPGGIAYGITSLFSPGVLSWIIGAVFAVPFFFLIVFSPLSMLGGMFAVFNSNIWTLMFRQMKGSMTPPPLVPSVPTVPSEE